MKKQTSQRILLASGLCTAVVLVFGIAVAVSPDFRTQKVGGLMQTILAHAHSAPSQPFPNSNTITLTPLQQRIVTISKQEYAKKPVSFDATVLKYSAGNKESWCADFVSWVLLQAGQPLHNPNSGGGWRIPGTATLQEYYQAQGKYEVAGTYTPKVGDVAIYRHDRSHVNFVIAVSDNTMTTVGGNETGHIRINTQSYTYGNQGLSGFGIL